MFPSKSGWACLSQDSNIAQSCYLARHQAPTTCTWQPENEPELKHSLLKELSSCPEPDELCGVITYDSFGEHAELASNLSEEWVNANSLGWVSYHQQEFLNLKPEQVLPSLWNTAGCMQEFHSISLKSSETSKIIRIPRSDSDAVLVFWVVEAKKVKGKNRSAVSPPIEVRSSSGEWAKITISLSPLGGKNFLDSKGCGKAKLKCETDLAVGERSSLAFSLGLCSGCGDDKPVAKGGPIIWDLSRSTTCELPEDQQAWDLGAFADSQTLAVCVELQGQKRDATVSEANQLLWPT